MNNILAIICNRTCEGGISTEELHNMTKISKEIIESNLNAISNNPEMYFKFIPYKEDGKWKADFDYEDNDSYILSLNSIEKGVLDSIIKGSDVPGLDLIQKNVCGQNQSEKYIEIIGAAIMQRKIISAKYNRIEMKIEPLKLVYYEFENIFYLLGQYEHKLNVYNLERIENVKLTKESFKDELNVDFDEYLSDIWGMEQDDEPVRVKIKFKKEVNVEDKVKRELEFRKHKKISDYDKYFIYEDDIIGINSFKNWLRSFGSSAIVIKPEELREDMINSAKKALQNYR